MELAQTGFKFGQFSLLVSCLFQNKPNSIPDRRTASVIIQMQTVSALYSFPRFHSFPGIRLQGTAPHITAALH